MPCRLNANGQPLCHITDHPDRLGESFCVTCNKRFKNSLPSQSDSSDRSERSSSVFVDIVTGVLALLLAAIINQAARNIELPPPNSTQESQATLARPDADA